MIKILALLRKHLLLLLFTFTVCFAHSQSPFDLKRGEQLPIIQKDKINPNTNPFDLVRHKEPTPAENPIQYKKQKIDDSNKLPPISNSNKLLTLFLLLFLSTIILGNITKLISNTYILLTNTNKLLNKVKVNKSLLPESDQILLLLLGLFNISVFLTYSKLVPYHSYLSSNYWPRLGTIFLLLIILFVVKLLLNSILGFVFQQRDSFQIYFQILIISMTAMTIFFIPLNLLLIYAPTSIALLSFYVMLGLSAVIVAYFALRNIIISSNRITAQLFHFILYLCAFEIVPIALFTKYINLV